MDNTFWERMMKLLADRGYSLVGASKKMGYSARFLGSMKDRNSYPKLIESCKIADLLEITVEELATGKKPLAKEKDGRYLVYQAHETEAIFVPKVYIDEYGAVSFMTGENSCVPVPHLALSSCSPENLRAVIATGDEMSSRGINPDDHIIYDLHKNSGNGVYVITFNKKICVRRLDFGTLSTKITISTARAELDKAVTIEADEPGFTILGKVVLVIHEYE
jgi:hypothetical protein